MSRSQQRSHLLRAAMSFACIAGLAQTAAEPNKSELGKVVEEVLVTAQRRHENPQDVPISITVLSGVQLDTSTATGVAEVLRSVPGLGNTQDQG